MEPPYRQDDKPKSSTFRTPGPRTVIVRVRSLHRRQQGPFSSSFLTSSTTYFSSSKTSTTSTPPPPPLPLPPPPPPPPPPHPHHHHLLLCLHHLHFHFHHLLLPSLHHHLLIPHNLLSLLLSLSSVTSRRVHGLQLLLAECWLSTPTALPLSPSPPPLGQVIEAHNVGATRAGARFVQVKYNNIAKDTQLVANSNHPNWNRTFVFTENTSPQTRKMRLKVLHAWCPPVSRSTDPLFPEHHKSNRDQSPDCRGSASDAAPRVQVLSAASLAGIEKDLGYAYLNLDSLHEVRCSEAEALPSLGLSAFLLHAPVVHYAPLCTLSAASA